MNAALVDFSEFKPIINLITSYRYSPVAGLWLRILIPKELKLDVEKCKLIFQRATYEINYYGCAELEGTIASYELTQFIYNEISKRSKVDNINSFYTATCSIVTK